jgi:2-polyprenyl-6-methoxyphenol hydroxylase-like FAD-dependent oxidoreductase
MRLRRVAIVGAGPAGLYCAYLLKRDHPDLEVELFEQNPPDATFGFGVVFSDRALEFLRDDDPRTHDALAPELETWTNVTVRHRGESIAIDGVGFAAIGRLRLLGILRRIAGSTGVEPTYGRSVATLADLGEADLVIGADGVNSVVRRAEPRFGTDVSLLSNRFAWFGTRRPFATLTQTFKAAEHGYFNAHHYRFEPGMSTFIVEVDEATFFGLGFDRRSEDEARVVCERVFAEELDGHRLLSNRSVWRQFPRVRSARWSVENRVLLGDALHTAHFSIGSGTRLAMEDAIALARGLREQPGDLPAALAAYEAARRPIVDKIVGAADASAEWYEQFPRHMRLEPWEFAMSYLRRSGRVSAERLRVLAPRFLGAFEERRGSLDGTAGRGA